MHSKRPALGSRTLRIAQVALFLIGLSPSALAADFEVISSANTLDNGTFPSAIEQINAADEDENTISFGTILFEDLAVPITAPLPAIELDESTHSVQLDATPATQFAIVRSGEAEAGFNILDIKKGKATVVDLRISGGDFNIQDGARLEFKDTQAYADREVTGIIKGAGQLIKSGDQKLILSGANTYEGGTEMTGGILQGNREGLKAVTGAFNLNAAPDVAAPTLIFSDSETATWQWAGETTGEGKVVKEGSSTLELIGVTGFAHSGDIEITDGILEAASEKLGSADITVSSAGTLKFKETAAQTFGSTISGAGEVEMTGFHELELTGSNSFSGGLLIKEGTVKGSATSLGSGAITLENNSAVTFNQSDAGTFSGGVAGTGVLTKEGAGQLTLDGDLGGSVTTTLSQGILALTGQTLGSNITAHDGTTIIFQPNEASATFSGTIQGSGNFEKKGSNILTLDQSQIYDGTTTVSGGKLIIGGSLPNTTGTALRAATTIASGATLEAKPGSGKLTLNSGLETAGTLSIPDSNSSLFIDGTLHFGALEQGGNNASSLNVIVEQGGNAPIVSEGEITGTLTTLITSLASPEDATCLQCTLLESKSEADIPIAQSVIANKHNWETGGVIEVYNVNITPDGKAVTFDMAPNSERITEAAQTKNQIATAPALTLLFTTGAGDQSSPAYAVYEAILDINAGGAPTLRSAMDQMAPESLAAFTTARESNAQQFSHALWQRFRSSEYRPGWYDFKENESSEGTPPVSAPASSPESSPDTPRFAGWAQPFGIFANNDGRGKASDMKSRVYGLFGGVDYALPESTGLKVGAALGYSRYSIFSENLSDMQGQANTYQAALYGAWQNRHFHVGISGRYGYTNMRSQRRLTSFGNLTADARFSGQEYGGMIEIGATLGNPTFFAVRPIAAFQYDRFTQGSFRETGAGALSLSVDRQDFNSLLTTLGTRISKLYTFEGGFGIEPEIRVGWTYQAGDKNRPITAVTYNVPFSPTFTTYGAESDRNAIWVGAGYVMRTTDTVRVGLDYDAYIGKYYTQQVVSAELQIIW